MNPGRFSASLVSTREIMADPQAYGLVDAQLAAEADRHVRSAPRYSGTATVTKPHANALEKFLTERETVFPERYRLTLHNAIVAGPGLVFTVAPEGGRALIRESAQDVLARGTLPEGMARQGDRHFSCDFQVANQLPDHHLLLKRAGSNNMALWLVEQAAALALLIGRDLVVPPNLILGRASNSSLLDQICDLLGTLLPGAVPHHLPDDEAWLVERIDYLEPLHIPPMQKHGDALLRLQRKILTGTPQLKRDGPRYFVLQQGCGRTLANEPRILAIAEDFGFLILDTSVHSAASLASLFAGARAIVGAKGPAMAYSLFAPPGSRIAHISPGNFVDPFFWDLASRLGQDYTEIFCRIPEAPSADKGMRYFLPEPQAMALFAQILAE